jgi:hypothetical protein
MLETQQINVVACLFYRRCGFELDGFDRNLYRGLKLKSLVAIISLLCFFCTLFYISYCHPSPLQTSLFFTILAGVRY